MLNNLLRKEVMLCVKKISQEEKCAQSKAVCRKLLSLDEYKSSTKVLSYVSMNDELSTDELNEKALEDHKELYLPRVIQGTSFMEFYKVSASPVRKNLVSGNWGILEPSLIKENLFEAEKLSPSDKIFIAVPGVVFSESGGRVGHGKGFYDIFLSSLALCAKKNNFFFFTCGLAFNEQIRENLALEPHDYILDKVIFLNQLNKQ